MANKHDLVHEVALELGKSKKEVLETADSIFKTIAKFMKNHEDIKIPGFGNFEVRKRSERKGRNLQTGEDLVIPATHAPAFKPSGNLKEAVKNGTVDSETK